MMSRSPIDFDRERCFELIEMYKQSGMLWNPEHTDYYNKTKKNDAWNEIAANLQCDVNVIKGKMTSLLASFRREKMKTRRSREMGKPRDESRNWFGYKAFSFLLNKKKSRVTLNTTSLPKIQKESESSEDEEEEEDEEDLPACSLESKEEESVRTDTQNNSQTSEACLPPPQQKLKRKRHSEEESKLEEAYKLLKSNVEKDEYAVFGELLATKLRKLDEKLRLFVMHRINNILFEAEMQNCSNPQDKGRYILEYVCKQLDIMETDYFGLRYVDHCRQRHWLDLGKTAIKQIKDMDPILFSFRVKFYPPDPLRLKEEVTKNHVYQQLKRDLLHARLYCSPGEAALLAACIVQRELGDYDPKIHEGNYISEHKLLLKQTKTIEEKAMELHQTQLKGFTPEEAETHFLRLASKLDTYAVDPHPVKDHKGTQLYLGINHCGILTFQGWRKTHHFRWSEVQKINYEGKMFIVHLTISEDVRTKKKHTVGFKCPTGSNCRHVWRCAMEQMLFFTLPRASDAPVVSGGSIFSWGTKFKYTGRTEREVLEQSGPLRKEDQQAEGCQTTCLRRKASSVPATPSTPSQDLVEIRYSSLPRSCHSAGLEGTGMSEGGAGLPFSSPYCPDNTLPLLETVSEDQEIYARRNNAVDEKDSHASATHNTTTTTTTTTSTTTTTTTTTSNTTTNRAKVKLKFPKSTPNRPRPLYSQKIVIDSKELAGRRDIDNVVRQRMNALGKSPNIVRSTALIIKSSRSPMSSSYASKEIANGTFVLPTDSGTLITTVVDGPSYDPATGKAIPRKYNEKVSWLARTSNENLLIDTLKNSINGYVPPAKAQTTSVKNGLKPQDRTVGQHEDEANDYYFRDSFDHSSSESQLLDAPGKPHSRSVTPVPKMQKLQNSKLCLQQQHSHHHHRHPQAQHTSRRFDGKFRQKSVRIIRLFIPAFMLTIVVLFIVIVLVFETDTTLFNSLRKTPEMVALRNQYYVPIKEFLRTKLGLF